MRETKKVRYKGTASEILPPIIYEGYEILSLRHGNTGHVLYYAPRLEDLEPHWCMDLQTAKNGVIKFLEAHSSSSNVKSEE